MWCVTFQQTRFVQNFQTFTGTKSCKRTCVSICLKEKSNVCYQKFVNDPFNFVIKNIYYLSVMRYACIN